MSEKTEDLEGRVKEKVGDVADKAKDVVGRDDK